MQTPSHVAFSLLVWRNETGKAAATAVVVGAVLPDAPMFGFYAYQRLWAGQAERAIWSDHYFREGWQLLFDLFNSLPIFLAVMAVCYYLKFRVGLLLAGSAVLHMLLDLPLHHDDGHRHFLPFSDFRFSSPVSYWDPRHYGQFAAPAELLLAVASCCYVGFRSKSRPMRIAAIGTLLLIVLGLTTAIVLWS